jgi:hypothetical protein
MRTNHRSRVDHRRPSTSWMVVGCAAVVAAIVALSIVFVTNKSGRTAGEDSQQRDAASLVVTRQFAVLSAADTDVCRDLGDVAAIERYVAALPDGSHMQGSCCSPMDLGHFAAQLRALRAYAADPAIPADPYDISKIQAEQMLGFYDTVQLDASEQAVYAAAQSETTDHGWCCCQCWAWYTHAGLAKHLISQRSFDAQQTAYVIDLEDCCGGS